MIGILEYWVVSSSTPGHQIHRMAQKRRSSRLITASVFLVT